MARIRTILIVILAAGLLTPLVPQDAQAASKSFTINVSCVVPERLELAAPFEPTVTKAPSQAQPTLKETLPSKIQTQQITTRDHKKVLLYTITER